MDLQSTIKGLKVSGYYVPNLSSQLAEEIDDMFNLSEDKLFRKKQVQVEGFWSTLDQSWLNSAALDILDKGLPQVLVYLPKNNIGSYPVSRYALLLHLASEIDISELGVTRSYLRFPVKSLDNLKQILNKMLRNLPQLPYWPVFEINDPILISNALLNLQVKYPGKVFQFKNTLILNLNFPGLQFDPKDFNEPTVSKVVLAPTPEITFPPLQQREGEAFIEVGGISYDLGISYKELVKNWPQLSPWALARYERGLWTKYW